MEMRTCDKCGIEKPVSEFHTADSARGYKRGECKACGRDIARRYYQEHPEYAARVKERQHAKRVAGVDDPKKTPEEKRAARAAYMRQWLADHPDARLKANERARQWHKDNPEPTPARKEYIREWHKANPMPGDRKRTNTLRYLYGIGPEEYKSLLVAQDEKCKLCGTTDGGRKKLAWKWGLGTLSIDHCHTTGRVRGLLCHVCNSRLGAYEKLRDSVGFAAVEDYLNADPPLPG